MDDLDALPYYLTDNGGSYVWDLTFSPEDDYLLVGTRDGMIKRWAINNSSLASQICQYISRNMTQEEWQRYVSDEVDYENTCENVELQENG